MLHIQKISNIKNIYYKIILILSFIISWFSIGTHYTNLLIFTPNEGTSIIEIINFIREPLSLLCFPILYSHNKLKLSFIPNTFPGIEGIFSF